VNKTRQRLAEAIRRSGGNQDREGHWALEWNVALDGMPSVQQLHRCLATNCFQHQFELMLRYPGVDETLEDFVANDPSALWDNVSRVLSSGTLRAWARGEPSAPEGDEGPGAQGRQAPSGGGRRARPGRHSSARTRRGVSAGT
jgi:hypothetical protein